MTTQQVEFTFDELVMDHDFAEPLIANGVRCHGGFDADGTYVSPRTRFRAPAIEAWEEHRIEQSGTDALEIPLETWPASFPNVEQSKFLIRNGAPDQTISSLTRIGTVEGFGAMMRYLPLPDMQKIFTDDITGTATDHIRKGLFEAHARDEAGWEDEAGHNLMWFAARDIAFDNPVTEDQTAMMLERMGIQGPGGAPPDFEKLRAAAIARRVLPSDIDFDFESMLTRMIGLLFIEISAFHSFTWAEAVLADTELCAGEGEAARIISYVRQDETPHVSYLRVALSEMRDRTWVGESGTTYDGAEMIAKLWDRALEESRFLKRSEILKLTVREIEHSLDGRTDRDDLLDEFYSLGTVQRLEDGSFVEQLRTGETVEVPA
jgi:hypothetical protein